MLRTNTTGHLSTVGAVADVAASLAAEEIVVVDFDHDGCDTGG